MLVSGRLFAITIAVILFVAPFFWLKPGYVDLGGDAGRLYFLDPLASAQNLYLQQDFTWALSYAIIPYELTLAFLKTFVDSPTYLIALEHGIQLSISFLGIYAIVCEILSYTKKKTLFDLRWIGIASGIVYVSLITKTGWVTSLPTLNQTFLNPLLFYLLFRLAITGKTVYTVYILMLTIISGSFGFSSAPQLFSFFPLATIFLYSVVRYVLRKNIKWGSLIFLSLLLVCLHAFHLIPTVASVLNPDKSPRDQVFSSQTIQNSGVRYFEANHKELGKISLELFQPSEWIRPTIFILFVPVIMLLGLLKKPSKLLALTSIFFTATFFLTSANITKIGVWLYKQLFYIPGFLMFRSFQEKWFYVFSFFYALLFGFSLYRLLENSKKRTAVLITILVVLITSWRIYPFLAGKAKDAAHYQSDVSRSFSVDPDLIKAIDFVKKIPEEGNFLTLPLTFPYFQIAFGKEGGAYVGVSWIYYLGGRHDYPGFWSFGPYEQQIFEALRKNDNDRLLKILSQLNIRYIFYNSDDRVISGFPGYPSVSAGMTYSSKDQIPAFESQQTYKAFLASLPLTKLYEKGFYSVYKIEGIQIKPTQTNTKAERYFLVGRVISYLTTGAIALYFLGKFIQKKYGKN